MENTQREPRVSEETTTGQHADESQAGPTPTVQLGRMLANPRRVRRA
ncbi:hypothetical protein [Geodermatophilus sp. CPCC 206100]